MKNFLLFLLCFGFIACNTQHIRKERQQNSVYAKAQPDSFLFYQTQTIAHPFIDSLKINNAPQTVYFKQVPPPPPPEPKIKTVPGYRIQVMAVADSLKAKTELFTLKNKIDDPIYIVAEGGLFKLQVGNFLYRNPADMRLLDLRKHGIENAWVVKTEIIKPEEETASANEIPSKAAVDTDPNFKIQIIVMSDKGKAESLAKQLQQTFSQPGFVQLNGAVYKVFIGRFAERPQAEKFLQKIRSSGYSDAWIVGKK